MAFSIHFAKLEYFSEKFTESRNESEILEELKKVLKEEEKIDETIEKIVVNIDPQFLAGVSADTPEIKKFLTGGSEVILHPQSKYYFVTEELWQVLRKEIFKQFENIKTEEEFFQMARDCTNIENQHKKKMLIFEAS